MAPLRAFVSRGGLPRGQWKRQAARKGVMEPLISLGLRRPKEVYEPGETLEFEYQLDAVESEEVQAVEASALWYTEGKGDEDLAVHFFERRVPADVDGGNLCALHQVATKLPKSPLSY